MTPPASGRLFRGIPGLTYRRVEYWTRQGWLLPGHTGGQGIPRQWPGAELDVARLMVRLVDDGGLSAERAAMVARAVVAFGLAEVELGPGLTLVITVASFVRRPGR